jgi:hypothetical protein
MLIVIMLGAVMLKVINLSKVYAECHFLVVLSVVMLNVIMLIVEAPIYTCCSQRCLVVYTDHRSTLAYFATAVTYDRKIFTK